MWLRRPRPTRRRSPRLLPSHSVGRRHWIRHRGRPPSGGRGGLAGGARSAAFVANDCDLEPGRPTVAADRPQHGRQEHLPAPERPHRRPWPRSAPSCPPATRPASASSTSLFSRVGAADDLARGRSTFMVEMVETAAILNQAGPRVPCHPRRDRPRHRHLRRPFHRLGGGRAPARGEPVPRPLRHPLSRTDGAGGPPRRPFLPRHAGSRNGRAAWCSSTRWRQVPPTVPTASTWASLPACRRRSSPGPRTFSKRWRKASSPPSSTRLADDLPLFAAMAERPRGGTAKAAASAVEAALKDTNPDDLSPRRPWRWSIGCAG